MIPLPSGLFEYISSYPEGALVVTLMVTMPQKDNLL